MKNYSVIIIGGGPAGATAGQYLKEKNIDDCLIIEKGGSYRDKVCAGGIPYGVIDLLPASLKNFEKVEYDTLSINYKGILESKVKLNKPFLYGVERTKFDHHLRKGLNVHYNEKFIGFNNEKNNISVRTDKTTYTAKFLVGADGVGSRVSILSSLARKKRFILGEEKEIFQKNITEPNTVKLFLEYNYLGYGWILPKQDHYSAGSGALQKYFLSTSKGTVGKFDKGKGETKIYPISLWQGEEPLVNGRIALAGEAGNLVDPFTAAGIYPAMLSAKLLAGVIEKALKNGKSNLQEYNKLVINELGEEFNCALLLSKMFYPFLPLIKNVITSKSTMQQTMENISSGYISYKTFYRKVQRTRKIPVKIVYFLVQKFAS